MATNANSSSKPLLQYCYRIAIEWQPMLSPKYIGSSSCICTGICAFKAWHELLLPDYLQEHPPHTAPPNQPPHPQLPAPMNQRERPPRNLEICLSCIWVPFTVFNGLKLVTSRHRILVVHSKSPETEIKSTRKILFWCHYCLLSLSASLSHRVSLQYRRLQKRRVFITTLYNDNRDIRKGVRGVVIFTTPIDSQEE